jgi:hypothetical protein
MTFRQQQGLKLLSWVALILAIISIFIGWKFYLVTVGTTALLATYLFSKKNFMKILFCLTYHTLVFGSVWLVCTKYISVGFIDWTINGLWDGLNNFLNWIRQLIVDLSATGFVMLLTYSVFSCFSTKKLKKTDVGQWSFSGWMPEWGANEKNSWWGLFLGLPEKMIDVEAIPAVSKVITDTKQIQVEEAGNTTGRKFAAEFEFSFQYKVVNTLTHILRPNGDKDLVNFVVAKLTEWLNHEDNEYDNIRELKEAKSKIQKHLIKVLKKSGEMYGDEIENFIIVDIEVPKIQIEQQNKDAADRAGQMAADERDKLNLEAATQEALAMVEASKNAGDNPPMSFTKALEEIRQQKGITKSSKTTIRGGGTNVNVIPPP